MDDVQEPRTVTLTTPDGNDVEVVLPDEYMTSEDVAKSFAPKDSFMKEVQRRAKSLAKSNLEKMLEEDRDALIERLGITPATESDKSKPNDKSAEERITRAREEWEAKALKPVQTELESMRATVETLRRKTLHAEILSAAADAGVRKNLLRAPTEGGTPYIVAMTESVFGYDDENDAWLVRDGNDGWALSAKPKQGSIYKGAREFFESFASDKANEPFIDSTRQTGPGMKGSPRGKGGPIVLSRAEARDAQKYRAAKKRAEEAGTEVVVDYDT